MAFVSDTLNIYKIVHQADASVRIVIHNRFVIAPNCRITLSSNEDTLALSINDHPDENLGTNLIYNLRHGILFIFYLI